MGNLRFAIIRKFKKEGEMAEEVALEYDQDVILGRLELGIAMELAASKKWYRRNYPLGETRRIVREVFRGIVNELKAETIRIV